MFSIKSNSSKLQKSIQIGFPFKSPLFFDYTTINGNYKTNQHIPNLVSIINSTKQKLEYENYNPGVNIVTQFPTPSPSPPSVYTVTYSSNGLSGTAPVDPSSPYTAGSIVTVLSGSGLTGFGSWNTAANGSGTTYSSGSTFTITQNITLYAQTAVSQTYTVTYSTNGLSGPTPVDPDSPYTSGSTVTVLSAFGITNFGSWNTAANGSGTTYSPGNNFVINQNTTLYAQNTTNLNYTVTYSSNGLSGTAPVDPSSPYTAGSTVTILSGSGIANFGRWNTAANGSGTTYLPGSTFAITQNITLYAEASSQTYTVTYSSEYGTAPVDPDSPYTDGSTVTVLQGPSDTLRPFTGWNSNGTVYLPGDTFVINQNVNLSAIFDQNNDLKI